MKAMRKDFRNLYPRLLLGVGALLGLSSAPLRGEEALTWEACLSEAAIKNADVLAGGHSIEKSEAGSKGAYSGFFPTVSGTASYTHSNSTSQQTITSAGTIPGTSQGNATGSQGSVTDQYSAGLTVSQNIFNGFQDGAKVSQSKASLRSTQYSVDVTKAQVRSDLRNAFARALYNKELLTLNRDVVNRRNDNKDLVELRFEGGNENKGNYLRSKASYRSAQVDVSKVERDLQVSGENLGRLLGRKPGIIVFAVGQLKGFEERPSAPDFKTALSKSPSYLQAESDVKVAESGIVKSRGGYFPTMALNGSLYRQDTSFPPQNNTWSVGVTLSIPIFSGLSTYYDLQSSVAERDRAEAIKNKTEEQVLVTLKQSYADYLSAIEHAEAQEEAVQSAEVRVQIARGKYQNGLQSFEDWDLIENDLITQQQQLLSLRLQVISAQASWEQAIGLGVTQ